MCTSCVTIDTEKAAKDAFGGRLMGIVNQSATALMISLGHRNRLFDVMNERSAWTSSELAGAAGLSERYVREWLGAMTCGRIVELDPRTGTYTLPATHAAWLTRKAAPSNFAVSMQWVGLLGRAEMEVSGAFKHGKGVPYSAYEGFDEIMAEESGQTVVAALDEHILPLVPGLVARLERGIDVLDVGCGRGQAMLYLAAKYPHSRFVGYDFGTQAVRNANDEATRLGLSNARFETVDVSRMTDREAFDLITTFDAIHDQARPADVLSNIRRALRDGGTYLCQEIKTEGNHALDSEHPLGAFLYTISCMHCMSVSLANGGPGLGAAWGRPTCERMIRVAGFNRVARNELPHDPINDFYVCQA